MNHTWITSSMSLTLSYQYIMSFLSQMPASPQMAAALSPLMSMDWRRCGTRRQASQWVRCGGTRTKSHRSGSVRMGDGWRLPARTCLLYTSDAADERSSVDLGG